MTNGCGTGSRCPNALQNQRVLSHLLKKSRQTRRVGFEAIFRVACLNITIIFFLFTGKLRNKVYKRQKLYEVTYRKYRLLSGVLEYSTWPCSLSVYASNELCTIQGTTAKSLKSEENLQSVLHTHKRNAIKIARKSFYKKKLLN